MENKTCKNAAGVEFELTEDSFAFVQKDKKIHDTKFETKPTTFAKDALKRFAKNKSSVVASFIIGIIAILAIFVPIFSPANVSKNIPEQSYLEPKLFKAGFGFWDGTKKFSNIPYDVATETPVGFSKNAVVKITKQEDHYTNIVSTNAHGGSLKLVSTVGNDVKYAVNYVSFPVYKEDDLTFSLEFNDVDDLNGKLGQYQLFLASSQSRSGTRYALTELMSSYDSISINLSKFLIDNEIGDMEKAYIQIEIPQNPNYEQYILIEKLTLKSSTDDTELKQLYEEISMNDAALQCNMAADPDNGNRFPNGYWRCTGRRELYNAVISKVSFVYDYYEAQLGLKQDFPIGKTLLDSYVEKGWCKYSYELEPVAKVTDFEVLDAKKCPIQSINDINVSQREDLTTIEFYCDVTMYKYLGYKSMPNFILGTDVLGKDLFTFSLKALRTSLLLAIVVSAINFSIGLVWGSISGYFGGNVDLAMERFCDILGGVPFVVVITLAIILMGSNLVTFAIALCLTGWMGTAARTRTQFYRFKGREYILAARTLGASDKRLIFKHILPNSLGTIITSAVLMIPSVIFSEASIAYLGLGLKGVDSFGVLLSQYQSTYSTHPMLIIFPSIIISLLMISFNLFGNGLRDALNPTLKGSE